MYPYTRSLTTRNCTFTVVAPTRQLLYNWNCRRRPLDVCKPTQAQQRQDRIAMGRIETAFLSKAVVFQYYNSVQHHNSLRPLPFAGCDAFVRPQPRSTRLHCQRVIFRHVSRQLRRSGRSLDTESAATLVHAFVASRVDYCNAVLACAPKATTDKLQRVLNAAA